MLVNMFNVFVCLFLQVTSFRCCVFCLWYYGSHVSSSACAGSGDAGKRDKERTRRWRRASTTSAGHYWALARLTKTTQTRCRRTRTCFTLWIGLETEPSERKRRKKETKRPTEGWFCISAHLLRTLKGMQCTLFTLQPKISQTGHTTAAKTTAARTMWTRV